MRPNPTTIFISHASEDKDQFVRPLAHALKRRGLQVWYDEFSLRLGDSLRRSIDQGLANCSAGVVVLSPSFFAKEWPQRELDALYTAEVAGRSRILPIWHEVDSAYVAQVSPLLADRRAALSSRGVDQIAIEIAEAFPASAIFTNNELANVLERFPFCENFAAEALAAGCRHRFLLINAFKEEYGDVVDKLTELLAEEQLEEFSSELDDRLRGEHDRLRQKWGIPENTYLVSDDPVSQEHASSFLEALEGWTFGTLSPEDSARLVADLDRMEFDEYFVLLGLPNFSFSFEQRDLLEAALVSLGTGFEDEYRELFRLCAELRRLDVDS